MARPKKETNNAIEEISMSIDDMINSLSNDTDFVVADTGSLMSSRMKVSTPLYVINCIYGGGLPLGVMTEISGPPSSGKSTFSYQCLGNYQREYPDGIPIIYDMEASMDAPRLKVLGINPKKVLRRRADTIDKAFASMFKSLNEIVEFRKKNPNVTTFQIYDSLSSGGTDKQHEKVESGESAFNAGSMMEAPRIIKQNLSNVMPFFEQVPMFLGLINQVFMQGIGTYVPKAESGGGFGLKHLCHAHIKFNKGQEIYENGFLIGNLSTVNLEKSKLSPKFINIPCYIDATAGGRIDEVESFVRYLTDSTVGLIQTGAWYNMNSLIDSMSARYPQLIDKNSSDMDVVAPLKEYKKNFRKADLFNAIKGDKDLLNFLQIALIDFIDNIYPMQRDVNDGYQKKLMSECLYFNYNNENVEIAVDESINTVSDSDEFDDNDNDNDDE